MAYHRQQGVDTAIVRIFNTYGPSMRPHDGRAIPTFVRQALEDKPLTVFGDGSQTRSFCYVDDLIRGLHPAGRVGRAPAGEHRQPERVHAARARRDGASRSPARAARSCSRRSRSTTRRCASPTSRARRRSSAGSRRSTSRTASSGCSPRAGRSQRLLSKRIALLGALAAIACAVTASTATASPSLHEGDLRRRQPADGEPGPELRRSSRTCGTKVVRMNLHWGGPLGVAGVDPTVRPTDPNDGQYDWSLYDRAVTLRDAVRDPGRVLDREHAHVGEQRPGAPRRADEHEQPARLRVRRGEALQRRLPAAAGRAHPPEGQLLARVERAEQPDLALAAGQRAGASSSPQTYARICNAVVTAGQDDAHPRREGRLRRDRAAREQQPALAPSVDDAARLPARDEALRREGLRRLRAPPVLRQPDGDADHETEAGRRHVDHAREHRGARSGADAKLYGNRMRIWLTEYGYQTTARPGLRRQPREAGRLHDGRRGRSAKRNPRIDMFIWFLLKDDTNIPVGWQSGLLTSDWAKKPAYNDVPGAE